MIFVLGLVALITGLVVIALGVHRPVWRGARRVINAGACLVVAGVLCSIGSLVVFAWRHLP